MAKKKIRLQVEQEHDFSLVGIFSHTREYRISWLLNHSLGYEFRRHEDFLFQPANSSNHIPFPLYRYYHQERDRHLFLLPNRVQGMLVLGTPRNLDYILVTWPASDSYYLNELVSRIRNIEPVNASYVLNPSTIKGSEVFFYEMEMYQIQQEKQKTIIKT